MLNTSHFCIKKQNNWLQINIFIIILLFLLNMNFFNCQESIEEDDIYSLIPSLNDNQCFNNVILFDKKKYQAGNFAINKKGDLILELSEDNEISSSRLFYGLTKDGKYFFSNQTTYTQEINIDTEEILDNYGYYNVYGIYNSLNLFVSIKNDIKKGNQYLFFL